MTDPSTTTLQAAAARVPGRLAARLRTGFVAFASGAALSFAYPGWDAWFLAWFALVPFLVMLLQPRSARSYAWLSAAFGVGFFGGVNYWLLAMHPLTWLGPSMTTTLSLVVVFLAWFLLALILSSGSVAAFTAAGLTMRALGRKGKLGAWAAVLVPVCFWVAMEYAQANGVFGYTWNMLASTQYRTLPLLQSVALFGPFPLSGLIVAFNAAIAWGIARREWKPLGAALAVAIALSGFGLWWMNRPVEAAPVPVAVVQGNVSQTEKWQRGNEHELQDRYFDLSRRVSTAKLVAWPESALPVLLANTPALYDRFVAEAKARGQAFLTGTFNATNGSDGLPRYYNATTMFGPDGQNLGWDAKKHLVPFGEYLPGRHTLPPIWAQTFAQLNLMSVDMTPGERPVPFATSFGRVGSNVCFDSIFPDVMRDTARAGAEMFVLVTNDAWYKKTMALQQHLAHGVLRAVENRRPFLQAANTGASAVVDHTGRIVAQAPTWEPAAVAAEVRPVSEQTPYTRYGDWLSWLLMAGGVAFMIRAWRPRSARGSEHKD
ncbi:apolipoprotein N-acyltransferase [bacterium]|nr:apolipoprotein N-acyltransferase [bacterium]